MLRPHHIPPCSFARTHTHTHAWIRDLLCQCTSNSGFLFIGWESSILRLTTTDYRLLSSVSPLFLLPFPSVVPLCFTFSIHHLNFYQWGSFLPASRLFKTLCCFLNLFTRLLFCHEGALMHRYTTGLDCSVQAVGHLHLLPGVCRPHHKSRLSGSL